jgi:Reverse transcriptase (RNA-dependent DNA polymerase)
MFYLISSLSLHRQPTKLHRFNRKGSKYKRPPKNCKARRIRRTVHSRLRVMRFARARIKPEKNETPAPSNVKFVFPHFRIPRLFDIIVGTHPNPMMNQSNIFSAYTAQPFPTSSVSRTQPPSTIHLGDTSYFPIIWDTGASVCLTYDPTDFIGPIEPPPTTMVLKGLGSGLTITGTGMVNWYLLVGNGSTRKFTVRAYLVPSATNRLLSPQSYLQSTYPNGQPDSRSSESWGGTESHFWLRGHESLPDILVPYDNHNNLPISYGLNSKLLKDRENEVNSCITEDRNQNLTPSQKELLKWHFKLGHASLPAVQALLKGGRLAQSESQTNLHRQVGRCILPKCASCQIGKARRQSSPGTIRHVDPAHDGTLKSGNLLPGARVSVDHFICSTKGRLYTSRAKTLPHHMYLGGAIFVDHASKFIWVEHQVGTTSHETLKSKMKFEAILGDFGIIVQDYHTDNSTTFRSEEFTKHLSTFFQTIDFAGVGAHHHNGVAERGIQTIMSMARTVLLHAAIHWPDASDPQLWPMAVDHAVFVYNRLPDITTGMSPLDLLSGVRWQVQKLHDLHVWGSPTYVLDPTLQDGRKLPRWTPRARRGAFLGVSKQHSSTAPLILNLTTGSISPQYHCVFDDSFSTVSAPDDVPVDTTIPPWSNLFRDSRFQFTFDEDQEIPPLASEWSDEAALRDRDTFRDKFRSAAASTVPDPVPTPIIAPIDVPPILPPRVPPALEQREPPALEQREPPALQQREPLPPVLLPPVLPDHPPPPPAPAPNLRRSRRTTQGTPPIWHRDFQMNTAMAYVHSLPSNLIDTFKFVLAYVAAVTDPDTLRYDQAVLDSDWPGFRDAMGLEISALEAEHTWDVVSKSEALSHKILPGTWTFRRKRHPDGRVKKLKARFCVRGDLQETNPQTYAPVVQWSTVRLLMYFALFFEYETRCIDFSNAFVQAKLDVPIYIHLPRGFYNDDPANDVCLKLNRSLYGLKEAPRLFYLHLRDHLLARHMTQSTFDPCLFYGDGVILVCFVDDCILVGPKASALEAVISDLRRDFLLTEEGELAEYLGIDITRNRTEKTFTLKQTGLIDRIIVATGLTDSNPDHIPAITTSLGSDPTGLSYNESWNYASIVGMLLYLSTNSRPDIAYAVNQVARFTHDPKESHSRAVKKIVRYLKGTRDKGLIMRPQPHICLDCYVDADFGGLFGVEDSQDPICVKSRTGYVILMGGCPLVWASKLQSIIALSTTEAEYVALSQSMRQLLPMKQLVKEMSTHLDLHKEFAIRTMSTVFEDNNGALLLAQGIAPKMTPRSKHIAIIYHWWRYHVERGATEVVKIDTKIQQADILTKGLPRPQFEELRLLLMGW